MLNFGACSSFCWFALSSLSTWASKLPRNQKILHTGQHCGWFHLQISGHFHFPSQILLDNTSCLRTTPTYFSAHAAGCVLTHRQLEIQIWNSESFPPCSTFRPATFTAGWYIYRHCTGFFFSNRTSFKSIFFQSLAGQEADNRSNPSHR